MPLVAEKVAELKGVPVEEVERVTTANFIAMCQRAGAPGRVEAVLAAMGG